MKNNFVTMVTLGIKNLMGLLRPEDRYGLHRTGVSLPDEQRGLLRPLGWRLHDRHVPIEYHLRHALHDVPREVRRRLGGHRTQALVLGH